MSAKTVIPATRLLLTTAVLTGAIWFAEFLGLTDSLIAGVQRGVQPLQGGLASALIEVKLRLWQVRELYQAEQAVVALRQERAVLLSQLATLPALQAENQALRKLVENSDRTAVKSSLATPIISFAQPALAVDPAAGIKPGMMVITENQLLGFVATVQRAEAQVTLLQASGTRPVLAKTPTGVVGLVQGDGQRLWLTEVPPDQPVKEGELVVTVGQAGVAPQLVIGTVRQIEANPSRATQSILIQPPNTFFELAMVELR